VDIVFQYPPQLMDLLIDTIPRLCRGRKTVLLFFEGAGVEEPLLADLRHRIHKDPKSINKFDIARTILTRLNQRGESTLRERREVLKRVVEFENFSTCWPDDRLEAKGLVAEIRKVIDVKDSFTRMSQEREAESRKHRDAQEARQRAIREKKETLQKLKAELFGLFKMTDQWDRGRILESVLNRLFQASEILVRESFTLRGDESSRVVEQIDGLIEIDGHLYLVEIKWWDDKLGVGDVAQHLVRVYHRGNARGIFISARGYTDPAIESCRDSLQRLTFILTELEEIVRALEIEMPLADLFRQKVVAAISERRALKRIV